MLDRYYLPVLFSRGGRVVTLLAAAGLAVLGGFGLFGLRMGLEPQLAAPTDFYLQARITSLSRSVVLSAARFLFSMNGAPSPKGCVVND